MEKIVRRIWIVLVLVFIYAPIVILSVYSFTDSTMIGQIKGFSIENYITLFSTEELRSMIIGTIVLALVVAFLSTVLGTVGAIGTFYSGKNTKAFVESANNIPVVNADVVTGFSVCILMIAIFHISKDTYIPLIIGQVALCVPFVYLSVTPRLKAMDVSLYEAAMDLGCSSSEAMIKVVLPQLWSGIMSGFTTAITLSLDDYFIATYTKPATFNTISTFVVNATRGAQTNIKTALWALSTVIFVLVVVFVLLSNLKKDK